MDDLVKSLIKNLQGNLPFTGWTGYNHPSDIQRKSNLWVVKAGARVFSEGFSYDPKIMAHTEWGAVVNGQLELDFERGRVTVDAGMFYIIPSGVEISANTSGDPLIVWVEFEGGISTDALEIIGGKPGEAASGRYFPEQIKDILNIAYLLHNHPPGYNLFTQSIFWKFIADSSGASSGVEKLSPDIQRVLDYIHTAPLNEKISVLQLATISLLSVETFRKRFLKELGEAPIQYLLRYRISCAKSLLNDPNKPIKQIAMEAGFSDQYYFSRLFKRWEGVSPIIYRKKMSQLFSDK